MEWPPIMTHPTSAALARPPRKMEETTLGGTRSAGKPTMLRAVNGRPPIAKISESELAAAICPYENGSSTMGVKKSTVCTRARCRSRRYTPASSKVFELTSTLRSREMGSCGKTCRRACWLNLDAHPAQDESDVSLRICSRDIEVHLLSRFVIPSEVEESRRIISRYCHGILRLRFAPLRMTRKIWRRG